VPSLKNRFFGSALAVPVPTVSVLDLTAHLSEALTIEEVNQCFRKAAEGELAGVLAVTDEELVSSDFIGNSCSAVVDAKATMTAGPLVKVNAWYDNEWGYAHRVCELAAMIAERLAAPVAIATAEGVQAHA
jgi:glyceraldehyde 3-phosphate dehydrogenase